MRHPGARARLCQRKVIVEPVFGDIKTRQRFTLFRRRGLSLARAEFALQCLAYNLDRVIGLTAALVRLLVTLALARRSSSPLSRPHLYRPVYPPGMPCHA